MRIFDFIFAARPMLHLPIWTIYLITLYHYNRATGGSFRLLDLGVMAGISLLFTSAAYLNQVADYHTDRINHKVGFLQRGFIRKTHLLTGSVICAIVALAFAAVYSIFLLFLFAQFYVLAYAYSSPPLRLKDRPILGLLANAYPFGALVSLSVMPNMDIDSAGLLDWSLPLYFFLSVGGVYVLTTISDRQGDAATGKRTVAVALGRTGALLFALVFVAGSVLAALVAPHLPLLLLSLATVFLVIGTLMIRTETSVLLASKLPLLLLTLLACTYYPVYFLFIVAVLIACRTYYSHRFGIIYPRLL